MGQAGLTISAITTIIIKSVIQTKNRRLDTLKHMQTAIVSIKKP
jgi:hypothetical protein